MDLHDRLDSYLSANGLEAVWFAQPNSFAWLTGGDNVVDRAGDVGVAAAGYDGEDVTVVTNNIEAPRLRDEELRDSVDVEAFDWYEQSLAETVAATSPTPAAADFDVEGFQTVDPAALRQPLTDRQIEQYRRLSTDVAEILEGVARGVEPTDTERDVAARLYRDLEADGISTPVVLVGGSERAQAYRHFTPKETAVGGYALLSVSVERDGLVTSATRTVAFDAPEWLQERTREAMRVEATALAATQTVGIENGTAADVFSTIQDAYAAVGWEDEWQHHHQGGAAGYAGREWIATPTSDDSVVLPQAYAWNPTVQGAKSEDTHLVTADSVETLSATGDWPTVTVEAIDDGLELERHAVLEL